MINGEERHIGKRLRILSNLIRRKVEYKLNQRGIDVTSSQARILGYVYRQSQNRNVYQRDIEMEFDIRRSSVTNTLQLLEKDGYISRVSVDEDARLKKIVLTDKGISIYEGVGESISEVEEAFSAVFTLDELNELFYLLDKLRTVLEE